MRSSDENHVGQLSHIIASIASCGVVYTILHTSPFFSYRLSHKEMECHRHYSFYVSRIRQQREQTQPKIFLLRRGFDITKLFKVIPCS